MSLVMDDLDRGIRMPETVEVTPKKKYTVSFSIKVPIPNVPYSSVQTMISISGDNYEEAKDEAMDLLEKQLMEVFTNAQTALNPSFGMPSLD